MSELTELARLAIAEARAEGYRAGLEDAADECKERAILNDSVEPADPEYGDAPSRAIEARECEHAIRALAKEA